jgi:hypothetical protein
MELYVFVEHMMLSFSISCATLKQVMVDKLVKVAYENWENVSEYDSSSLSFDPAYKLTNTYNEDDGVGSVGDSTRHEDQPLMYNSSLVQAPNHSQSLPAIANTTGKVLLLDL